MSFRISSRADRDLDSIWEYVAKESDDMTADRVDAEIHRAIRLLAQMPGIGHQRPDAPVSHYRFWKVLSYLIVYRMEGRMLVVIRVVHAARDLRRVFKRR